MVLSDNWTALQVTPSRTGFSRVERAFFIMQFRWRGKVAKSVGIGIFRENVLKNWYTYTHILFFFSFFSALTDVYYSTQCNAVREKCIRLSIDQF